MGRLVLFRSIQWRITLPFILLIVFSMVGLGAYLVSSTRNSQLGNLRSQLENEARLTAEASLPSFINQDAREDLNALASKLGEQIDARVTLISRDGTVLGDSREDPANMENHAARPEIKDALVTGLGGSTRYSTTLGQKMMYMAVPVSYQGQILGFARVALPLKEVESLVHRITVSIATAMVIVALLVILIAWLIARITTRPIRALTVASRRIASGELGHKITVGTGDEVGELAHALNEMSLKLKRLVEAISGDRSRLASILDNMADAVIMTDREGKISLINRAAEKLFKVKNVMNKPLIEAVRDHEIDEALKACLQKAVTQDIQYESSTSKRFLRAITIPITDYKPGGVLILCQDLTDIRNLQTTRRELIGNISHEFRTPLAGIKALVETMRDIAIDDKETAKDFLNRIDSEVDRLTQMVAELSELSCIETGSTELKLELVNLSVLVEEVVSQLGPQLERQQLSIKKELAADLPSVKADIGRVRQLITNLMHNAIKFTPSGGSITVSSRFDDNSVTVEIDDTGVGIAKSDLPRVFERFYKADRARSGGGTGMGLAIAKHVVEAHGGNIRVRSEEGKGSVFRFDLPLK